MIELTNLTYRYGNGRADALNDVTAMIGPGIHLLLGENGAGKTTMLSLIAGWIKPRAIESVTIDGIPTALREPSVTSRTFMLTDEVRFPLPTIALMAKYHAPFYPNFSEEVLKACMNAFGLSTEEKIDRFSLGNRKKAMLAYSLALQTDYLLLDEPTNGLDITSRQILLELMAQYCPAEQTVIVSTHTVMDLKNLFESVIVLHGSRLILNKSLSEIEKKLSFIATDAPVEGAVYMRESLGRIESIVPAEISGRESDVDFSLLFNALQSESASALLKILNDR